MALPQRVASLTDRQWTISRQNCGGQERRRFAFMKICQRLDLKRKLMNSRNDIVLVLPSSKSGSVRSAVASTSFLNRQAQVTKREPAFGLFRVTEENSKTNQTGFIIYT